MFSSVEILVLSIRLFKGSGNSSFFLDLSSLKYLCLILKKLIKLIGLLETLYIFFFCFCASNYFHKTIYQIIDITNLNILMIYFYQIQII